MWRKRERERERRMGEKEIGRGKGRVDKMRKEGRDEEIKTRAGS